MGHSTTRAALLHLAADATNISNQTLKRSLDLLAFLEIEELEITSVAADDWGAVTFALAAPSLPSLAVRGNDVTACSDDPDDVVAKLVNAITCAYEADALAEDDEEEADDD